MIPHRSTRAFVLVREKKRRRRYVKHFSRHHSRKSKIVIAGEEIWIFDDGAERSGKAEHGIAFTRPCISAIASKEYARACIYAR